jgi:hypothetical protein
LKREGAACNAKADSFRNRLRQAMKRRGNKPREMLALLATGAAMP